MKTNMIIILAVLGCTSTSCTMLVKNGAKNKSIVAIDQKQIDNHEKMLLDPSLSLPMVPFTADIGAEGVSRTITGPAYITGWNGGSALQIIMGSAAVVIPQSNSFIPFSIPGGSTAIISAAQGVSFWGYKTQ